MPPPSRLAAPQIAGPRRIFVSMRAGKRRAYARGMYQPADSKLSDTALSARRACLSIPVRADEYPPCDTGNLAVDRCEWHHERDLPGAEAVDCAA